VIILKFSFIYEKVGFNLEVKELFE